MGNMITTIQFTSYPGGKKDTYSKSFNQIAKDRIIQISVVAYINILLVLFPDW